MADVTYQREDFREFVELHNRVMAVVNNKVKQGGTKFLPKPNPNDLSPQSLAKYEQYKKRAMFVNYTRRTLVSLTGAAFTKNPEVKAEQGVLDIIGNIDGAGVTLFQQSQKVLSKVLSFGRHGLLVDHPKAVEGEDKALRPKILSIDAGSIINWRNEDYNGESKLALVVYDSSFNEVTPDGFGEAKVDQMTALRLTDGIYHIEVWRKSEGKDGKMSAEWAVYDNDKPKKFNGEAWDHIPFTFVGSENNDSAIDYLPMYDLADVNIHHYCDSADYQHSLFFCGQAQPVMIACDQSHYEFMEKKGILCGSDSVIPVIENGDYKIVQAKPNSMAREGMQDKRQDMIGLGARLVSEGSAVKTATQADNENETEHSVLSLCAENVSSAYTKCLQWMGMFFERKADGEYSYIINQEFTKSKMSSEDLMANIAAVQSGLMPKSDFFTLMRKSGKINPEKTDQDILDEAEAATDSVDLED